MTEPKQTGWTVETLKEHLLAQINAAEVLSSQRFAAAKEAVNAALAATEKAIKKSEDAAERRFENVNEFRGQLSDQARTFMPRAETVAVLAALAEKIDTLAARVDRTEGRSSGLHAGWVLGVAAIGGGGTVAGLLSALQ